MKSFLQRMVLCLSILLPSFLFAQNTGQGDTTSFTETKPMMIGVSQIPPFVIKNDLGDWTGISVALWRKIADELHINFQ